MASLPGGPGAGVGRGSLEIEAEPSSHAPKLHALSPSAAATTPSVSGALSSSLTQPSTASIGGLRLPSTLSASSDHHHYDYPPTGKDSDGSPGRQVHIHIEPPIQEKSVWQRLTSLFQTPEVAGNEVRTAKYSILTFIPVNLFQQFCRIANLYFLIIAGLQLVPGLSPTSWFTTVFPLACVLIFNALKEAHDDYHRHRSDAELNSRQVLVLRGGGREVVTAWQTIVVGDLVKVLKDREVPADLVVLSTSDQAGVCFVETANLDGETNLKTKVGYARTAGVRSADDVAAFADRHVISCEAPNARLYVFEGAVASKADPVNPGVQQPLTADNLLLRGSTLRKTDWVIGVAVFAGADSKIMMNRTLSPRKITQMERHMNVLVLLLFLVLFTSSCLLAMGNQLWQRANPGTWYLGFTDTWPDLGPGFAGWIIQVIRFMILLSGVIPISLYVTLELIKVLQCVLVLSPDLHMYHADTDTPFRCHTTNLNEDLGQVQYVLSDKTGTLTQNIMGFVWASIGGQLYGRQAQQLQQQQELQYQQQLQQQGHDPSEDHRSRSVTLSPHRVSYISADHDRNTSSGGGTEGEVMAGVELGVGVGVGVWKGAPGMPPFQKGEGEHVAPQHIPPGTPHSLVLDPVLHTKLGPHFAELAGWHNRPPAATEQYFASGQAQPQPDVAGFFIHLALCNTVVPSTGEDGTLLYQASSPDEEALVQGAAYLGYRLLQRSAESVTLEYNGRRRFYDVLAVLEFTSERKRMSIICRCPDGKIRLFCKGADTTVMARIRAHQPHTPAVRRHLVEMAQAGYRTLCIAQRELQDNVFQSWHAQWQAASVAVRDREGQMAKVSERIETQLELLGATAVEDKLQDGVPEAVASLLQAGLKVWVLTGDKLETAINVALSCRLFDESMSIVELRERDFHGAPGEDKGPDFESEVLMRKVEEVDAEAVVTAVQCGRSNVGLVVEGAALSVALKPALQDSFVRLCSACKAVVFCRVSPMQKANATKLVKSKLGAITLGIGDGANDVGMIQAAHIGCGISGREGRAAVMASDFSFAQFRYLARLLLVHGRSCYKRNREAVQYSFYKNFAMSVTLLLYAFVSGYSCQPLFVSGLLATINVLWSSYVVVGYAVLEQDVSPYLALQHPGLYRDTMRFDRRHFLTDQGLYLLQGLWHGLAIYFVPLYSLATPDRAGTAANWVEVGCTIYTALVVTINLKLAMRTRYWTWPMHAMLWASILTLFLFYYLYGLVWLAYPVEGTADMAAVAPRLYCSPQYWLAGVLLAPALSLLPDYGYMTFQRLLRPKAYQVFQEIEQRTELKMAAVRELGMEIKPPVEEAPEA